MARLNEEFRDLAAKRRVRKRQVGDGKGVDIGIGCLPADVERVLDKLSPDVRARLLAHVRTHVDEAMKPILRALEREHESVDFFRDVGPNMLRTVIEYLEEGTTQV